MENVIRTTATPTVPALYKAAAVSVIALSVAGIGAMTGYLPVKKADAPANIAVAAPATAPVAAPAATPAPVAAPVATPTVTTTAPAVERAAKPRIIKTVAKRTDERRYDEPVTRSSGVASHPVAVSASNNDNSPYGSQPVSSASGAYPVSYPQVAHAPIKTICYACGTIESIREIEKPGEGSGLGMAGGALGGAVVGKQFGNGRGRDAMTILGAIGGGFAGHQVEKSMRTVKSYEVQVRMEDGSLRSIPSATQPSWRPGERVKVDGGTITLNS